PAAPSIENPTAERTPATAHLFIVNPLTGHGMDNLFSTHPSTENRIAALERLAAELGSAGYAPRPSGPAYPQRPAGPWGNPGGRGGKAVPWGWWGAGSAGSLPRFARYFFSALKPTW